MKAWKDPVQEIWGMNYRVGLTEEFENAIGSALEKITPFAVKEISRGLYYFSTKDGQLDGEYDCCENDKCVKEAKKAIRANYGKGIHIQEHYTDNDGDHENIELCNFCGIPLNEYLTWCESELEYLEQNKPWTIEFLKEEAFLIQCILTSTPTLDCDISAYAKHNKGEALEEALEEREQFFQRILGLAEIINKLMEAEDE